MVVRLRRFSIQTRSDAVECVGARALRLSECGPSERPQEKSATMAVSCRRNAEGDWAPRRGAGARVNASNRLD